MHRIDMEKNDQPLNLHPNLYIRDTTLIYWKDMKHLSPEYVALRRQGAERVSRPCRTLLRAYLQDVFKGLRQFLYEGSLHGVKYIFEPSFSRRERAAWVAIMAVSVAVCTANMAALFAKWTSAPFVNVMDSLPTPVWALPFPSVALCPHLTVKAGAANVSALKGMDEFFASLLCPQMHKIRSPKRKLSPEQNVRLQDFIIKASPKCSEVITSCFWKPIDDQAWVTKECCDLLFKPVYTDYGLCYAFNRLPLNGMSNETISWQRTFDHRVFSRPLLWSLDGGYPKVFPPDPGLRPYRAMASGEANGLGVELYLNMSEHQFECDGSSVGFNLLIGSPTDHLYTSTVVRLPTGRATAVEVAPVTYRTDQELRSLKPGRRQCYFQDEKRLQYYSVYTDSNCKHDLLITEAKKLCNCVLFNWPRKLRTEAICSTEQDFQCIQEVNAKVEEQLIYAYYADSAEHHSSEGTASCYPSCNDILYSTQVYYSDLNEPGLKGVTRINVHFYDDMFIGLHRHAQYDEYYLAGAVGGLLSLFLGFSIISVAEFVYFVMLRPVHRLICSVYCRRL